MHLNIYIIQNKFEDLTILNRSLKAQILVLSETKINRQSIQIARLQYVPQEQS